MLIVYNLAWLRLDVRLLLEQELNMEIIGEVNETGALLSALPHMTTNVILLG